jgi:hypothetical protein
MADAIALPLLPPPKAASASRYNRRQRLRSDESSAAFPPRGSLKIYLGSVPGCGSAMGKAFAPFAGAGGAAAGAAVALVTGADAADELPPVLLMTAFRNRCAVLSLVVTSPFMMSEAVTPGF